MTRRPVTAADVLARDAGRLADQLTRDLADGRAGGRADGRADAAAERAAAAWVHAGALVGWTVAHGLADPAGDLRKAIACLAAAHPALASLDDPSVNPMHTATPSAAALAELGAFWVRQDLDTGARHDTRMVGDIYQALSAEARTRRALVQTPGFVADLILHCTLDRAIHEGLGRGLREGGGLRIVDPSCGTGHLLVDAARRLEPQIWLTLPAGRTPVDAAAATLAAVHGVDIDPYAVAVARWRLVMLACAWTGLRPEQLPTDLPVQVEAGDALLADPADPHGPAGRLLARGRYHVVVGNPPYVAATGGAYRDAVRAAWPQVVYRQSPLYVPFCQLMHELAVPGGWIGQITANSFQKREFGRRLVDYLATVDLRWVIDTAGAYIPGHGTPTCILISRNQPPADPTVRAVQGVRGEPAIPADPARGRVWSAIRDAVYEREALDRLAEAMTRAGVRPHPASTTGSPTASQPTPPQAEPAPRPVVDITPAQGVLELWPAGEEVA